MPAFPPASQRTHSVRRQILKTIIGLRWWIIALVCLGTIVNYLSRNALGVMAPELMKLLHMSTQQ